MNEQAEKLLKMHRERVEILDQDFMRFLVEFLEQRREVIASIASVKADGTKIPIRASDIEAEKIEKRMKDLEKTNPGLFLRSAMRVFWSAIFAESVELQSRVIHAKRRSGKTSPPKRSKR